MSTRRLFLLAPTCLLLPLLIMVSAETRVQNQVEREKSNPIRSDRYDAPLPPQAIARMGTLRFHHHDVIFSLALSPDGKLVATAGGQHEHPAQRTFRLWDAKTGRQICELGRQRCRTVCVAFSPDGTILASAGEVFSDTEPTIHLWCVATRKELRDMRQVPRRQRGKHPNTDSMENLVFSPDGKILASSSKNIIHLWEVATGKELCQYPGHIMDFSPDGKELVTADYQTISLWDLGTGKELHIIADKVAVSSILFSPNGREIVTSSNGGSIIWWDRTTGKKVQEVKARLLASSPDRKVLVIGDRMGIHFWNLERNEEFRTLQVSPALQLPGVLSVDRKTLVMRDWNVFRLWDAQTGKELAPVPGHSTRIPFLCFSTNGKELISAGDSTLRWWDSETGKEIYQIKRDPRWRWSASQSANGTVLVSEDEDGTIRVWDTGTRKEVRRLPGSGHGGPQVAMSPDGKTVASIDPSGNPQSRIILRDVATGNEIRQLPGGSDSLAFSPDGKILASVLYDTRDEGQITLWDVSMGEVRFQIKGLHFYKPGINRTPLLAFSPDSKVLATGCGADVIGLWEVASGNKICQYRGHSGAVWVAAFSPDGRVLASGGHDGKVILWEITSGQELARFTGHRGGITALAYSPDGRRLASASSDATALVWDVAAWTTGKIRTSGRVSNEELEKLWTDLREEDAAKAFRALWRLTQAPAQAIPLLKDRLRSIPSVERQVAQLLTELDGDTFLGRERATKELERMGREAEGALRAALRDKPSPEVRSRLLRLLEWLPHASKFRPLPESLRAMRGVQVLEYIGSPSARKVLEQLAEKSQNPQLVSETKASLERLNKRR